MKKFVKISIWAGVAVVIVATAALLWWIDDGPEAVNLEAAIAQLETDSPDAIDVSSTTRLSESPGTTSTASPDDELSTGVGVDAEAVDTDIAMNASGGSPDLPATDDAPPADIVATTNTTSADTLRLPSP